MTYASRPPSFLEYTVGADAIRERYVKVNVLGISLLQRLTGFLPKVGLEQELKRTWEYMKANEKV